MSEIPTPKASPKTPPPLCISYALVQATVGVGTVMIPYIGVAYTRGGGGYQTTIKTLTPMDHMCTPRHQKATKV